MLIREFPIENNLNYPLEQYHNLDEILFFDIETTGLSADTSYLYLIGCIYHKESSFHMIQWFSEGIQEEILLLNAFFSFAKQYKGIIHFNGNSFDIPYILKKCNQMKLDYHFNNFQMIDLYKKTSALKKILKLPNYRQKTLEEFLKIARKDTFGGGDLIAVYQSYLGKKHYEKLKLKSRPNTNHETPTESDLLLGSLLLHNEEDLKGLLALCVLLAYEDLFKKPIDIQQAWVENNVLFLEGKITNPLPSPIHYRIDLVYLEVIENKISLQIQLYEGELRHYYANYKDYYYLPAEDRAVHKSVAQFVEKEFKKKAKISTAYTRKSGIFAPQYSPVLSPYYQRAHNDALSFLEIHTDYLLQEDHLKEYAQHIMNYLFLLKNKSK